MELESLKTALKQRFGNKGHSLALILVEALRGDLTDYDSLKARGVPDEAIIEAFKLRLILPLSSSRSLAWEDRILKLETGERYEFPGAVRYTVVNAFKTAYWDVDRGILEYFVKIGDQNAETMTDLSLRILRSGARSPDFEISVDSITSFAKELEVPPGKAVAELKGGGIMSPKLRRIRRKLFYEVNPSLIPLECASP